MVHGYYQAICESHNSKVLWNAEQMQLMGLDMKKDNELTASRRTSLRLIKLTKEDYIYQNCIHYMKKR